MKRVLFALLCLLALCLPSRAQNNVEVQLSNFQNQSLANRACQVQYYSYPGIGTGGVIGGDLLRTNSDSNGIVWLTNIATGTYAFTILAPPQRTFFAFLVTNFTSTNWVNITNLLVASADATFPVGSVAWAAGVTDGRYARIGQSGVNQLTSVSNTVTITPSGGVGIVDLEVTGGTGTLGGVLLTNSTGPVATLGASILGTNLILNQTNLANPLTNNFLPIVTLESNLLIWYTNFASYFSSTNGYYFPGLSSSILDLTQLNADTLTLNGAGGIYLMAHPFGITAVDQFYADSLLTATAGISVTGGGTTNNGPGFSGNGASLTNLNGANIQSATIPASALAASGALNGYTFNYNGSTWATVPSPGPSTITFATDSHGFLSTTPTSALGTATFTFVPSLISASQFGIGETGNGLAAVSGVINANPLGSTITNWVTSVSNSLVSYANSSFVPLLGSAAGYIYVAGSGWVNSLNINLLVGGIAANYQVTNWPHSIWVSPSGSDSLNNGTNSLSPFATLTNAIALVEAIGGSNVIHLEQGSFPFPASTYIPSNTCIVGAGEDATYLVPPIAANAIGLVINSNNILIKDLTIGTNTGNGSFYFPLVPTGGTNVVFMGVKVIGDSDGVYAGGVALITNAFYGTFINCIFKTDYDCVTVGGTGNGTNSLLQFIGCTFTNTIGTDFVNQNRRCIVVGQNSGGSFPVSVQVQGCIFSSSNNSSLGFVTSIEVNNPNSVAQVSGNIYNFTNASTGGAYGAYIATGTLNVVGGIDPNTIDNVGGTINYATNQFASLASTPLNPSALTGSGTIPYSAYGGIPTTNLDRSMGVYYLTNCKPDYQSVTNFSTVSGTTVLYAGSSISPGPFTSASIGKTFVCGTGSSQFSGSITNVTNSWTAAINVVAGSTVTNQFGAWGTDNNAYPNSLFWQDVTNALSNGCHVIMVPPGLYGSFTFTTNGYGAGYSGFPVPLTNCDLKTNGGQTLSFIAMQRLSPAVTLNTEFPQPLNTNGSFFCCPAYPPGGSHSACVIGVPAAPSTVSYGFVGLNLVLEDIGIRSAPNPVISGVDALYCGLVINDSISVDDGTTVPYTSAPGNAWTYGIVFPALNNWGQINCIWCQVDGYYTGFMGGEHINATLLWSENCHTAMQLETGYHESSVTRFLIQGCAYGLYPGATAISNRLYIGSLDFEMDENIVTGLNFQNSLYDPNNSIYGGCGMVTLTIPSILGAIGAVTNVGGTNFSMPNVNPDLTQVNLGHYSYLTVTTNFALSNATSGNAIAVLGVNKNLTNGTLDATLTLSGVGLLSAGQMGTAVTNFANTLGQAITNAAGSQASLFLWDTNINVSCVTNQIQTNGFHGTTANNYTNWWLNVGTNHTYRASLQTNNAAYCLTNIQGLIAGQDNWVDLYLQNTNSAANITLWWAQGTGAPPTGYISILNGSGFTNGLLITNSQGWYHLHGDIYGTNYMTNATWEVSWPNL